MDCESWNPYIYFGATDANKPWNTATNEIPNILAKSQHFTKRESEPINSLCFGASVFQSNAEQ